MIKLQCVPSSLSEHWHCCYRKWINFEIAFLIQHFYIIYWNYTILWITYTEITRGEVRFQPPHLEMLYYMILECFPSLALSPENDSIEWRKGPGRQRSLRQCTVSTVSSHRQGPTDYRLSLRHISRGGGGGKTKKISMKNIRVSSNAPVYFKVINPIWPPPPTLFLISASIPSSSGWSKAESGKKNGIPCG